MALSDTLALLPRAHPAWTDLQQRTTALADALAARQDDGGLWHTVVHSNVRLNFGPLSWLLNSPAYHRRHHSAEPEHFNSNYSALFPIFDVISGSYHRPDSYPDTGLDTRPANIAQAAVWPLKA